MIRFRKINSESPDQDWNILRTFLQAGYVDGDSVEPVVKVLPEFPLTDMIEQVNIAVFEMNLRG